MDLQRQAKDHFLLVAHRGAPGGNIPCNTIAAYENALICGADMLEIDVSCSADGKLFIFHPGMEQVQLGKDINLSDLPYETIRTFRYLNGDRNLTPYGICSFEEVLDRFRGKAFLNVDKFWLNPKKISEVIRSFGMTCDVLVKCEPRTEYLDIVETYCHDMPFMPIIKDKSQLEEVKRRRVNFVGSEVLFDTDDSTLASPAFIGHEHDEGRLLWCNAIVYDSRAVLAGGHSDDRAILGDREGSWGWIYDRGFDLMQTDFTLDADLFLASTGRRKRTDLYQ